MHYAQNYGHNMDGQIRTAERWSKHNWPHDLLVNCKEFPLWNETAFFALPMDERNEFSLKHSLIPINRAVEAWRAKFGCDQLEKFCPYNDECGKPSKKYGPY